MKTSTLKKPLGCLLFVILLFAIVTAIIDYFTGVVEVNVIKKIDPTYITRHETAEKERKKQEKIAEEEAKRIMDEIALENAEDIKERQMATLIDTKKIESALKKGGYSLFLCNSFVLNDCLWVYGELLIKKTNDKEDYLFPAILISENNGNDYKTLKVFEELCRVGGTTSASSMVFLEKNIGWLSIYGPPDGNMVYKTDDGGYTWKKVLITKNISLLGLYTKRIRVIGQNVYFIMSFQKEGFLDLMESSDDGKSWTYKHNNREVAKTFNGGLTWEAVKRKK